MVEGKISQSPTPASESRFDPMANELRDKGIEIANQAVQADNAGQFQDAINKYCKAAEYLLTALKYEKNPVTLKTIREKCAEYTSRAEALKEGLVGMDSVKVNMRKLCKQLSLDIKRRQEGHNTLDSIRHMMFTGNPGVGKTTVSRLVAKLYHQLGVSSKDTVVEVQKGDLVAGYVNQTAMKTSKKIKEAKGGILFVDEAYQLTQALQRGQSDFSGEAIDEMMKVMNDTGRKATTFVFAGYKKEMDEFVAYNAGLESRIKYRFHFDDYTVPELVSIMNKRMDRSGYKLTPDASRDLVQIIDKGTTAEMRSKYNGRLIDNLLQWSSDEMNTRLPLDASGDDLVTLHKSDLANAIKRFATARPPTKTDFSLMGGKEVETQLARWDLQQYSELFVRAGYRQLFDLLALRSEKDVRALGVTKDADVRRAMTLISRLEQQHREMSLKMDALYIDPDTADIRTWLEKRSLGEYVKLFERHKIDFEILGDLTYDDIKELGIVEVGPRRKVFRAISQWREERDIKKAEVIRQKMAALDAQVPPPPPPAADVAQRLEQLRHSMRQLPNV